MQIYQLQNECFKQVIMGGFVAEEHASYTVLLMDKETQLFADVRSILSQMHKQVPNC